MACYDDVQERRVRLAALDHLASTHTLEADSDGIYSDDSDFVSDFRIGKEHSLRPPRLERIRQREQKTFCSDDEDGEHRYGMDRCMRHEHDMVAPEASQASQDVGSPACGDQDEAVRFNLEEEVWEHEHHDDCSDGQDELEELESFQEYSQHHALGEDHLARLYKIEAEAELDSLICRQNAVIAELEEKFQSITQNQTFEIEEVREHISRLNSTKEVYEKNMDDMIKSVAQKDAKEDEDVQGAKREEKERKKAVNKMKQIADIRAAVAEASARKHRLREEIEGSHDRLRFAPRRQDGRTTALAHSLNELHGERAALQHRLAEQRKANSRECSNLLAQIGMATGPDPELTSIRQDCASLERHIRGYVDAIYVNPRGIHDDAHAASAGEDAESTSVASTRASYCDVEVEKQEATGASAALPKKAWHGKVDARKRAAVLFPPVQVTTHDALGDDARGGYDDAIYGRTKRQDEVRGGATLFAHDAPSRLFGPLPT
eukprot:TRINITY_DN14025_c1_g1_i1.p1 TRINITY_DN14025_c1_g1~~TRINITY_DN14025_c1_g1_i1.p1  ORF type:complete len:523 (+),score=97.02 TRINITY_DN14025_c1_g1_i1:98-1570(+)